MDIKAERTLLRVLKYDSSLPAKEGSSVPSGFVLKLYQMVNGAPDEIISVRKSSHTLHCGGYSIVIKCRSE